VIFAATAPPTDLHVGVLVGLAGLAFVLETLAPRHGREDETRSGTGTGDERGGLRGGAWAGWVFGVGVNLVALRFVPEVVTRFTPLPWVAAVLALVLLAAGQAVPWAIAGLVARALAGRLGLPAFLGFALAVYVATFVPAIFPWTPAGGLAPWPVLLQIADVVGERGVSLVVALAAGLAAHGVVRARGAARELRAADASTRRGAAMRAAAVPWGLAVGIVGLLAAHGTHRMGAVARSRSAAGSARIALVQPGFDATARWDPKRAAGMLERLGSLTRAAEARGAELVVWPESAYPYTLPHATRASPHGERAFLGPGVRGPVLTGVYMSGAPGVAYNAAVLVTPDGALSTPYDKRHLLWFGEAVPFAETFPWLARTFARGTGLSAGREEVLFSAGPIRAAVLNCYEDTLPAAGREAMEVSPNLLVNVTNDAWFAGSAEGELHLRLAVLRAIETRRDLVRAVNLGPTSMIDATGKVRARYDLGLPGSLPATAALLETPPTLYARYGDAPLVLLALGAIVTHRLRSRSRSGATPA